ncbi:hypothetical protein R1flu_009488 [Riccia fluitans]|uniref:Uncharacterized protein n=1 Tax=Riccia fluitans TaxID=41844 RepID=A0ABD1Z287_9MARC
MGPDPIGGFGVSFFRVHGFRVRVLLEKHCDVCSARTHLWFCKMTKGYVVLRKLLFCPPNGWLLRKFDFKVFYSTTCLSTDYAIIKAAVYGSKPVSEKKGIHIIHPFAALWKAESGIAGGGVPGRTI